MSDDRYTGSRPQFHSVLPGRALNPSGGGVQIMPEPWMADAVCATTDPEAFFVEKGGSTKPAKRICATCPVAKECLDYAMEHDERFGVWGGLSERERRRLKRGEAA